MIKPLLEDRVFLITGASRGIGKAIARTFAQHQAAVIFTYLSSQQKAKSLEAELNEQSSQPCMAIKSDASQYKQTQDMANKIMEKYGKIDGIVNNAGITRDGLLIRMSLDQWQEVIEKNLQSVFNTAQVFAPYMMKQRKGVFVNISSIVGLQGNAGQSNYAASKAGIIGFSKSIAKELGSRNIRTNVIAPGFIQTDMTEKLGEKVIESWKKTIPLKRLGQSEDVAQAALFLASDMSSYINGQVLSVCGGMI